MRISCLTGLLFLAACGGENFNDPVTISSRGSVGEFEGRGGDAFYPIDIWIGTDAADGRRLGIELRWAATTSSSGVSTHSSADSAALRSELVPATFLSPLPGRLYPKTGDPIEETDGRVSGPGRLVGYSMATNRVLVRVGVGLGQSRFEECREVYLGYDVLDLEQEPATVLTGGILFDGLQPNVAGVDLAPVRVGFFGQGETLTEYPKDGLFEGSFSGQQVPSLRFQTVDGGRVRCEIVDDDRPPLQRRLGQPRRGEYALALNGLSSRPVYQGRCQFLDPTRLSCAERYAEREGDIFAERSDLTIDVRFRLRRSDGR